MHKKYRDRQGRAIPWIKTRYAKPYLFRCWIIRSQAAGVLAMGLHRVKTIQAAGNIEPAKKKLAIAKLVIDTISNMNTVLKQEAELIGPSR